MCGIAGYITETSSRTLACAVQKMTDAMARRGPNSEGLELWNGAALGHRRLSILDLSDAGKQPMMSPDGEVGVVFNGCIYNFEEIRRDLQDLGCRFHSTTDTEILVHGYRQWGVDALTARMRGMFAIGIWDNTLRRLTLIRDRLGVKPLVWYHKDNKFAFASTVTALHDAGLADEINPNAMLEFFEFGWVSDAHSIYRDIHKLPPATILEFQNGKVSQRTYWNLPEPGTTKISFSDAVDETERLLLESTKLRLIADVPVGTLLSAGIDSALVCWATAQAGANIKAFTVGTPGDRADESVAATRTAQILGIPHEVIQVNREPLLSDLINAYGEPFACSSSVGMLQVCRAVKDRITVLLTGDGGDDVFLGYPHQKRLWYAQRLRRFIPGALSGVWAALDPVARRVGFLRRAWRMVDYGLGGLGAVTAANNGLPWFEEHDWLGDRLHGLQLSHRSFPRSPDGGHTLVRDYFEYERKNRFVGEYLTKVDGASMFWGVEARSPFLDQKIWEFAAGLPLDVRMRGGELKAILREIVRRRIGKEVATRPKSGFTIPVERWLAGHWAPEISAVESESLLEQEGWLCPGTIHAARLQAHGREAPVQLWTVLILEHWLRRQKSRMNESACLSFS